MKKKLFALLFTVILLAALALPAWGESAAMAYVFDLNDLLSWEEWSALETRAGEISANHGCGVYIITVENYLDYGTGDVLAVAEQLFSDPEQPLGLGQDRNGVLLLLSMAERDYALFVHGDGAMRAFPDQTQALLEDAFLPALGENDWQGGFSAYLEACDTYLTQAPEETPGQNAPGMDYDLSQEGMAPMGSPRGDRGKRIAMAVGISCLLALIVCGVLWAQMRSVRPQSRAWDYAQNGLQLTDHRDHYTHTTETRRRIEPPPSSGGGHGGSHSSHSSSSSGRSGKF